MPAFGPEVRPLYVPKEKRRGPRPSRKDEARGPSLMAGWGARRARSGNALPFTSRSPLRDARFARGGGRLATWLSAGLAPLWIWLRASPCCAVIARAGTEYAPTGNGKSKRPACGIVAGRPFRQLSNLPAYCSCYPVGSIGSFTHRSI
jgi:hypothetical protein